MPPRQAVGSLPPEAPLPCSCWGCPFPPLRTGGQQGEHAHRLSGLGTGTTPAFMPLSWELVVGVCESSGRGCMHVTYKMGYNGGISGTSQAPPLKCVGHWVNKYLLGDANPSPTTGWGSPCRVLLYSSIPKAAGASEHWFLAQPPASHSTEPVWPSLQCHGAITPPPRRREAPVGTSPHHHQETETAGVPRAGSLLSFSCASA